MKTLQKTLAAIFALLALALFVACSSDSADSSDSDSLGLAGTTWTSSYVSYDRDGSKQNITTTIEFGNDGESVVMYDTYTDEDDDGLVDEDSGTYRVDGSRVILDLQKWGTYYLVYSSGQLVFAEVYTQTQGSASLGSAISDSSLAGTTWECRVGFSYNDAIFAYTLTIEFGDSNSFTMTYDTGDYYEESLGNTITATGTYSVDASTVTLEFADKFYDSDTIELTYSSGELVYCNDLMTFTKD